MAIDREKLLLSAAKFVEKKKFDKALLDYQRIVQADPGDTRTLLKIGDLQAKMQDYSAAIATYDQVAQKYTSQGFQLKAIAVLKQIRELLRKHAPELAGRYSHVTPRLAEIYAQLGLNSDALTAFDEVATQLQKLGRDREAAAVFQRMITLDEKQPYTYVRLGETYCRLQSLDPAITSFWQAAQLLESQGRPDEALRVIERILHFRGEPKFFREAARLLLSKGDMTSAMAALNKLQNAFAANPKDLETLGLLAQSFLAIEQEDKALAVHLEMARLAKEQNESELYAQIVSHLATAAPNNEQVRELLREGAPPQVGAEAGRGKEGESSVQRPIQEPARPSQESSHTQERGAQLSQGSTVVKSPEPEAQAPVELDDEVEYLEDGPSSAPLSGIPVHAAPIVQERDQSQIFEPEAGLHRTLGESEAYRAGGHYDQAIEVLHLALEQDPNSIPLRQKLREILVELGNRDYAIAETLNIAIIHLHRREADAAEALISEVLEIEPGHEDSLRLLDYVAALRESPAPDQDGHLHTYDLEAAPPSTRVDASVPLLPDEGLPPHPPLPAFDEHPEPLTQVSARPSHEAIEEVLEEAEFFASQGLFEDAEAILHDMLERAPEHVLLSERLREVQKLRRDTVEGSGLTEAPHDAAFDIAASLDAMDDLGPAAPAAGHGGAHELDADAVFAKFKEGIKATVAESDAATHYDLGVAYKEMGLLPDAQAEFELASRDPARTCMCQYMIGLIHQTLGNLDGAALSFQLALSARQKTAEQEKALNYELGLIFETKGDPKSYQHHIDRVYRLDPNFRDVAARYTKLHATKAPSSMPEDDLDAAFDNLFN